MSKTEFFNDSATADKMMPTLLKYSALSLLSL